MKIPIQIFLLLFLCSALHAQQYWLSLPKPTTQTLNRVEFVDSVTGWIAGRNGTLMKTSDGGKSWVQQISNFTGEITDMQMLDKNNGWVISPKYWTNDDTTFGAVLFKTTNSGGEWKKIQINNLLLRAVYFVDTSVGFIAGFGGVILKTTDGGSNWKSVGDSAQHKFPIYKIKMYSPQYGYAVGGMLEIAGIIWQTKDFGETWHSKFVASDPFFNLHFFDSLHVLCGMADIDASGAGFMRTTDAGSLWSFEATTIWGEPTSFAFRTESDGWVPMGVAQINLHTTDKGMTWEEIRTPSNSIIYDICFPTEKYGYMVGRDGVLFKFNSSLVPVKREEIFPTGFQLFQNYPNPFNHVTTITFYLPQNLTGLKDLLGLHTTLKIYDVLGREIATLVNDNVQPGTHTVQWNAGNISSGVYFYQFTANSFMQVKKMQVVK